MKWSFAAAVLFLLCTITLSVNSQQTVWWNIPYPSTFDKQQLKNEMSFISVKNNQFVDENGKQIVFRGVNISDPDKLTKNEKWSKEHFAKAKEWGSNIIRVPVHPIAWQKRGKEEYIKLLDEAVIWANELNIYLIFEWHSIGNLITGVFQHPMYNTTKQETFQFWRIISARYKEVSTIAFYEIFNEPTTFVGQLGPASWSEWKKINEDIISLIFANDEKVVPLVAGFNWGYDLTNIQENPINAEGIGYVAHPYPQKSQEPLEENWEKSWGYVADKYPLIATELGFMAKEDIGAHIPCIGNETYGKRITDYLAGKGASWTVWCFDPDWPPQMISDWNYTPTKQGEFFKRIMHQNN